jgi:hypothetical protein
VSSVALAKERGYGGTSSAAYGGFANRNSTTFFSALRPDSQPDHVPENRPTARFPGRRIYRQGLPAPAQKALYWLLEEELIKATRPMLRLRTEIDGQLPDEWLGMEPGQL